MSEAEDSDPLYEPSDERLADVLRRALGMPDGWQPPQSMLRDARAALRAAMVRRRRFRRAGRDDMPPPVRTGAVSGVDALVDWLCLPEGLVFIDLMLVMPLMLARMEGGFLIGGRARRFQPSALREAQPIMRYAREKLRSPDSIPDTVPVPEWSLVAAVNCCTRASVERWLHVLKFGNQRTRRDALDEMRVAGEAAVRRAAPMQVWLPEAGPPRGLLPDPRPRAVEPPAADPAGTPVAPRPPVDR